MITGQANIDNADHFLNEFISIHAIVRMKNQFKWFAELAISND